MHNTTNNKGAPRNGTPLTPHTNYIPMQLNQHDHLCLGLPKQGLIEGAILPSSRQLRRAVAKAMRRAAK